MTAGWRGWMDTEPWRVMMICADSTTCTHSHHVKMARARWQEITKLNLTGFASAIHDEHCVIWMQSRFHSFMRPAAERACGPGGRDHVAHFAALPWVIELHRRYATSGDVLTLFGRAS